VLENLGVDLKSPDTGDSGVGEAAASLLGAAKRSSGRSEARQALDEFGTNLTQLAAGKLDPVVGRQQEIERAIQILGRRTKNNPVFDWGARSR